MGNPIFNKILEEKIDFFKYSFKKTSKEIYYDEVSKKLIHPGEFGVFRENVCKEYLRLITPLRLDFGSGFLINDIGEISTQIDIIIYDKSNTPLIQNNEMQRFFPVETVVGIVEVKSDLNKIQFKEALNKLSKNKILKEKMSNPSIIKRDNPGSFSPENYIYDNIFSILICNKLNFDLSNIANEIDDFYDPEILTRQKHNLIISLENGIIAYFDENGKTLMHPLFWGKKLKNRFIKPPTTNPNLHLKVAGSYIFMGTVGGSVYYPEITDYLDNSLSGGILSNQK